MGSMRFARSVQFLTFLSEFILCLLDYQSTWDGMLLSTSHECWLRLLKICYRRGESRYHVSDFQDGSLCSLKTFFVFLLRRGAMPPSPINSSHFHSLIRRVPDGIRIPEITIWKVKSSGKCFERD